MATHKVILNPSKGKYQFDCSEDDYILDQAEEHGIELP